MAIGDSGGWRGWRSGVEERVTDDMPTADDLQTQGMPPELLAALRGEDPNAPNAPFAYQPGMGPLMPGGGAPAAAAPAPPPTDDRSLAPGQGTRGTSDPTARLRASFGAMPTPTAPPPTDDQSLTMPAVPQPPNLSNSPLAQLLAQVKGTQDQINAVPRPDPSQLKPRLWERILGGVLGATQLRNPENAGAVASEVVNRRLAGAQRNYDVQTSPLYKQLQSEREGLGVAEAQSRIPQQNFENQMQTTREGREQKLATGRIANFEARSTALQDKFVAGTETKDENSPTGWTAETFGGDRKPFSPKSATTPPKEPKNADEAYSAASAAQARGDTKEATRLAALGDKLEKQKKNELYIQHRPPATKDDTGYTPGEKREIDSRSRRYDTRVKALEKSRSDYVGSQRPSDVQALAAIDAEIEQNHQKMDAIEQDVMNRRPAKATPAPSSAAKPSAAAQPGTAKPGGGKVITDKALVGQYLQKAGGDKDKARQLIVADGWRLK